MKSTNETAVQIVEGLSSLILIYSSKLASEQWCPQGDSDSSYAEMKRNKEIIKGLRKIREEFETIITGMI